MILPPNYLKQWRNSLLSYHGDVTFHVFLSGYQKHNNNKKAQPVLETSGCNLSICVCVYLSFDFIFWCKFWRGIYAYKLLAYTYIIMFHIWQMAHSIYGITNPKLKQIRNMNVDNLNLTSRTKDTVGDGAWPLQVSRKVILW